MEFAQKIINGYPVLFFLNENNLKIIVEDKERKGKSENEFISVQQRFKDSFKEYISDFKDLIEKINEGNIFEVNLTEVPSIIDNSIIKYLLLKISKKSEIFISIKIFRINVKYYLVMGPKNERLNPNPNHSYIEKDYCNIDDIIELLEKENVFNSYIIDFIKYFDNEKRVFREIKNKNIQINKKIIFEIHIKEINNFIANNIILMNNYYNDEIIKIKNKINKYSDIIQNYDLIYLYASPIIKNDNYEESDAPISYMKEIRSILKLMEKTNKKFNCKFECINEEVLKDILFNYKTKILHISAHGSFDGKYSLSLENLKDKGKTLKININELENLLLNSNYININQLDLVFISTCYSEDFAKKFLEHGAKNVIYIEKKTEINNDISVIFTELFYQNLIEGHSIIKSFENARDAMKNEDEVKNINYKSTCDTHFHEKNHNSNLIKFIKSKNCNCRFNLKPNHHHKDCEYYKNFKSKIKDAKEEKIDENIYGICCCDLSIEHSEILKIKHRSKNENILYGNISSYKFIEKGKIFINSTIRYYFDQKKFIAIKGRKGIISRVFNSITKKEKFCVLFGEKGYGKLDFAESLCVYLYERKIINNYEIFRINSKEDLNDMKNQINEYIESKKSKLLDKKNVIIIKFDNGNDDIIFDYLMEIYTNFCNKEFSNKLYFIFIFNTKEKGEDATEEFIKGISEKKFNKELKLKIDENLFYAKPDKKYYNELFDYFLKESDSILTEEKKQELINKAKSSPKIIEKISNLILKGKNFYEIINMKGLFEVNINLLENQKKSTFLLYYLLLNMPSGLPNSFLKLVFEDFSSIEDNKGFIVKSIEDNWKIIKKDKYFYENFKVNQDINDCCRILFRTLKIYTKLLNFFINKNRKKIYNKDGNIHYIYNSYNTEEIWKCNIPNNIEKILGKKILSKDFNIIKHKQNIINLISLIINKIELIRNIPQIGGSVDNYIENILILFPSYFFLKKDNSEIIQICINFCDKLIKKTQDKDEKLIKREQHLKHKLLLYLYSIDKSKDKILKIKSDIDGNLCKELDFLETIRKQDNKIANLKSIENNFPLEKKIYLYYEYSKIYFIEKKYQNCLNYLQEALNLGININDIIVKRLLIDYCYAFRKKYKNEIDDYYNLIENTKKLKGIMKKPIHKNLYIESCNLRKELYNLLEPDIVMLNSNPLKNKSNLFYPPNNQYFILNELKQSIKSYIRIKSNILNRENLNNVLSEKGKILIIQSDDFTENGDIVCENENGESDILLANDFIKILKSSKEIKYQILILCFPKSSLLIKDLYNFVDYLITFEYFNHSQNENNIMIKYNKNLIQFLVEFITNYAVDKNDINSIFEKAKNNFINNIQDIKDKINSEKYAISTVKQSNKNSKTFYKNIIKGKKVFLYGSFLKLKNCDIKDDELKDYSSQIYDLVEHFSRENIKIIYCNNKNQRIYLNISYEIIKYFYRHKTFYELFNINFKDFYDQTLLKSLIKKLNEIKKEDNEESEEEDEEDTQQKFCFILIYNCETKDMIEMNLFSVLNTNNSFLIICNEDRYFEDKKPDEMKKGIKKDDFEQGEKFEDMFDIIENLNDDDIFFMIFGYNKIEFIDEEAINSNLKQENEGIEFEQEKLKEDIINTRLEIIKNGNLYEYLKSDSPLEGEEFVFPFNEAQVKIIFYKIIKTIAELHSNNACHLGLQPACISFNFDEKNNNNPIIINLGTIKKMEEGQKLTEFSGEKNEFIPLELYEENLNYDGFKVDIFSLGIILFMLLFRRRPFKMPLTECDVYQCVKEGRDNDFWDKVNFVNDMNSSGQFKNLFIKMIAANPDERFSIKDVINHDWMKDTNKLFSGKSLKKLENLENDMNKNFKKIINKIKEKREKVINIKIEKSSESQFGFESQLNPKSGIADFNKHNIIKIKGAFNPNDLMNDLADFFKKLKESSNIDYSKDELKFIVTEDDENNNAEVQYSIELYENENADKDEYFLDFNYISGSLSGFYNRIESGRQYLESLS